MFASKEFNTHEGLVAYLNQMILSQHHRIGKALGEIKELEGEE